MTGPALLAELRALDFGVRAEGARLLVTPPGGGRLHPDDEGAIRAAKAGLLEALAAEAATARVTREAWPPDPAEWPAPAEWPPPPDCPGCPWCEPRRRPEGPVAGKCRWCDRPAEFLCDFVTEVWTRSGRKPERWDGRTCDAPMCAAHRHQAGAVHLDYRDKTGRRKGHTETTDYCPDHAPKKE